MATPDYKFTVSPQFADFLKHKIEEGKLTKGGAASVLVGGFQMGKCTAFEILRGEKVMQPSRLSGGDFVVFPAEAKRVIRSRKRVGT